MSQTRVLAELLRFVQVLRAQGLRVSTAEVLDALRGLEVVNPGQRLEFKTCLKAALVKDHGGAVVFEEAFALFFAPPQERQAQAAQAAHREEERAAVLAAAEKDLVFQDQPLDLSPEDKLLFASLPAADQDRLRSYLERAAQSKGDVDFKSLAENLVRGQLAYWRHRLPDLPQPQPLATTGDPELDAMLGNLSATLWQEYRRLWQRDLAQVGREDMARVAHAIYRLSRRLATRLSRHYRATGHSRQRLDLRRTLRRNLRYGGAPFELAYRRRRVQKPQLVLLCDVSGSMTRYTPFILQFMYGLGAALRGIAVFLWSERLVEVSRLLAQRLPLEELAERIAQESAALGPETHLEAALTQLRQHHHRLLQRRTVVMLLSDTKTQNAARAAAELQAIRRRVRSVIWLNPLSRQEWERYPTVELMRRQAPMWPCHTLADLEALARESFL